MNLSIGSQFSFIQILLEHFIQLLNLRLDHSPTVSLARVLIVIILMVFLSRVELGQLGQLCDYLVFVIGLDFLEDFLCSLELLFGFIHDDGPVLSARVVPLAVQGCGVVERHENVKKVVVRQDLVVIMNPDDFGMSGASCADSLVSRIGNLTSGIATFDLTDSPKSLEDGLDTPEASSTDNSLAQHFFVQSNKYSDKQYNQTLSNSHDLKPVQKQQKMSRQKIKKMMLVGEQKVGKSSIIQYILKGRKFDAEHYPTVGVEAGIKSYEFQSGEFAVVQVWDTAGKHELHDYVCEKFYDDMNGFLIVADMSNQNSLSAAYFWSEKIKKVRQGERGYIVGIVANKSDVSKPEFTDEDVRRRFPLIKYYGKFSLKEQADPKTKTQVETSLQNFIRDMYENELPRLIVNDSPINNSNCNCSLM